MANKNQIDELSDRFVRNACTFLMFASSDDIITENNKTERLESNGFTINGNYSIKYLSMMGKLEFNNLLIILYKMPDDLVKKVFELFIFRTSIRTNSIYSNVKKDYNETYRISDHWNNLSAYNKNLTTNGIEINGEFCLGQKYGDKWFIVKNYGKPIKRNDLQKRQLVQELLNTNVFKFNKEITKIMQDILTNN